MKYTLSIAAALTLAAPAMAVGSTQGPADAAAPSSSSQDLRSAFLELEDEYDDALSAWNDKGRQAFQVFREARKTNPDLKFERPAPIEPGFMSRFLSLADSGSADAQVWVVVNYRHIGDDATSDDKRRRCLLALAGEPRDKSLRTLAQSIGREAGNERSLLKQDECFALLDLITAGTYDDESRATAAYYRASAIDVRRGKRTERAAAMAAMKVVGERFPETEMGQRAGGAAFAFEKLNIGQTAPDIVGKDVDGNAMKLSDFADKVVVLDFWGFW